MNKHTPGPWKIEVTAVEGVLITGNTTPFRKIIEAGTDKTYEASPDEYLIAAAPDLLAAAQSALSLIRGSGFTDNTAAVIELKSAIAKAEGR